MSCNRFSLTKKSTAIFISLLLILGLVVTVPSFDSSLKIEAETEITFKTQVGGIYDGMPLFDGNPDHLDAFVDALFAYR